MLKIEMQNEINRLTIELKQALSDKIERGATIKKLERELQEQSYELNRYKERVKRCAVAVEISKELLHPGKSEYRYDENMALVSVEDNLDPGDDRELILLNFLAKTLS